MRNEKMNAAENAIRSMYQMIVMIDEGTAECDVLDHNTELGNISFKKAEDGTSKGVEDESSVPLNELRYALRKNIHPGDREAFLTFTDPAGYPDALLKNVFISMECRIRHSDRKYYWSEIVLCNTTEEDSTDGNDCLLLIRNIHERKSAELKRIKEEQALMRDLQTKYDELFEENMIDSQTGCYNRKGLKYYSDMILDEAKKTGKRVFVCVTDLNGLKHLNDTYGHAAGDEAIAAVSGILISSAPAGSRIVRTGGDEFLLFAAIDSDSTEPDEMNEKIDTGLAAYNEAHSNPYTIGASYGWVLLPAKDNMTVLDEYVEMADAKMYRMRAERDQYRRE